MAAKAKIAAQIAAAPQEPDPPGEKITVKLDVRWYNVTGRKLYLTLGFKETERTYPSFYDFHGGVSMEAALLELASDQKRDRVPVPKPLKGFKAAAKPAET